MHAIANQVHENHPDYKIIYVTSEEFGNDLISSIKRQQHGAVPRQIPERRRAAH